MTDLITANTLGGWPLLSTITFLPLVGVVFLLFMRGDEKAVADNARAVALWTSVVTLALSIFMVVGFDPQNSDFQFVERVGWLGSGIDYAMGVDGISVLFVLLTTSLMPLCILASWQAIGTRVREYMIAFLVLETLLIGVFCAMDLILFYLFFEGGLIPMFLIIGIWGGARRIYACFKFFLFTLVGSVLMLLAVLVMYWQVGTSFIPDLAQVQFTRDLQIWLWLAFFAGFAVKLPMWPVHTWLPDAHVEAPTAGSVILAGVLLKLGGYGFLRFSLPMFPVASEFFAPMVFALSAIAVVYTSLVAFAQEDMKKLIAYSSVAHMGFVTMGLFSATTQGVQGAVFQMLSHGWISSALFLCVGVIYDRMHTRKIADYGGLVNRMPIYATVFMLFTIVGTFQVSTWTALFAAFGVILSACYALTLYRRVSFGRIEHEGLQQITDMGAREILIFAPLVAATLVLGVWAMPILEVTAASVDQLIANYQEALAAYHSAMEDF